MSRKGDIATDPDPAAALVRADLMSEAGEQSRIRGDQAPGPHAMGASGHSAWDPYAIGGTVLIRGIPWTWIGRVVAVTPAHLILYPAAWVGHLQRLHGVLTAGIGTSAVEPFVGPLAIRHEHVGEITAWPHAIPDKAQ